MLYYSTHPHNIILYVIYKALNLIVKLEWEWSPASAAVFTDERLRWRESQHDSTTARVSVSKHPARLTEKNIDLIWDCGSSASSTELSHCRTGYNSLPHYSLRCGQLYICSQLALALFACLNERKMDFIFDLHLSSIHTCSGDWIIACQMSIQPQRSEETGSRAQKYTSLVCLLMSPTRLIKSLNEALVPLSTASTLTLNTDTLRVMRHCVLTYTIIQ